MAEPILADLSSDQFAERLLLEGYYDVDLKTGEVWSSRSSKFLRQTPKKSGHLKVNLSVNGVVKAIFVHRLIALKIYGAVALEGMEVAHLDGVPSHNSQGNLKPMTPPDHVKYDGTDRNLDPYWCKPSWDPCERCGDPNGLVRQRTPVRITGRRFGIDGQLCHKCYVLLNRKTK